MPLKEDLKALIIKSGWTMTGITQELSKRYNKNISLQNFSTRLARGTLKYSEVEEVLTILNHSIIWVENMKAIQSLIQVDGNKIVEYDPEVHREALFP